MTSSVAPGKTPAGKRELPELASVIIQLIG
jgi:hypothetical protein